MSEPLLAVRGVTAYYGPRDGRSRASISNVHDGEIVTLNRGQRRRQVHPDDDHLRQSARAREGSIVFDGRDISKLPTHEDRASQDRAGAGRAGRIFVRMTVFGEPADGARRSATPAHFDADLARIFKLFPRLRERIDQARRQRLSGGEQQMLAIGAAPLMSRPRLLLLDEPSLGLAPLIARQIFDVIRTLNVRGEAHRLFGRA